LQAVARPNLADANGRRQAGERSVHARFNPGGGDSVRGRDRLPPLHKW
jgi:hypothetical protein